MSDSTPVTQDRATPNAANLARFGLPIALLAIYWSYQFACRALELDMLVLWLSRVAIAALVYLVFLSWWIFSRQVRRGDRWFALAAVVVAAALVGLLSADPANALMGGLPFVLTAWTIWAVAARRASRRAWRMGFASLILLTWAPFTLLRFEGLTGDQRSEIHWRWQPTAEEQFFAERAAAVDTPTDAPLLVNDPVVALPGDCTEFRGPRRDGVVRGVEIETDWKNHPPREVWRRRVGPAWSSVSIVSGRLFTQEQRGEQEAVVCYDASTGDELWAHDDPVRFDEAVSGAGPRATPAFADGRIYAAGATGRVNCLDAASGRTIWSRDLVAETGAASPVFGFWGLSTSPLVVDGLAVFYQWADGHEQLRAFDAVSGEPAWQLDVGKNNYSSPQLATLAGKRQLIFIGEGGLVGIDPTTGSVIWRGGDELKATMPMVQPHVIGDTELIVATDPGLMRVNVDRHDGAWKVENQWPAATRALRPAYNDFVVHQGTVYGFDEGVLGCIDLATGKRLWKRGRYGHGQVLLLADQDLLLVMAETGAVALLAADPAEFRELGRFQALDAKTWNHPVVSHGRLYVRNAEEMACYDLAPRAK